MKKVIGMLVALAMFCAMPSIAFAQQQSGDIDIDQTQGGGTGTDGTDGTGETVEPGETVQPGAGAGGEGGDGDNVQCAIGQSAAAGGDVSQEATNNCGNTNVTGQGGGQGGGGNVGGGQFGQGGGNVGGGGVVTGGGGVGGGGVTSVQLARTGFDAWMLALLGGLSLAGGLGLLVAQRRGRIGA